jgi:S-adenosylmethionine synthetase
VQLSYCIGISKPTSIDVNCFGTNKIPEEKISELVAKHFKLTPKWIIDTLKLRRPIFRKTAAYGHFGREDPDFTWEKTDKAEELAKLCGCTPTTCKTDIETDEEDGKVVKKE